MRQAFTTIVTTAAVLGLAGAQPAVAQSLGDKVSLIVKFSIDPSIGGTAIGAATGSLGGTTITLDEASWSDTHSSQSPLFEVGVGFNTGTAIEVLGLYHYGRAGANDDIETIGSIGGTPVAATFDDYKFWGLEGGVRLRAPSGVGPYGIFTGGFRKIKDINARVTAGGAFVGVADYEESIVPSFAFGGGMLWGNTGLAMGLEVAVRYAGAPATASSSITPASGAGSRWSLPIGVVLRF